MKMTAILKNIKIGDNHVIKMEANINGWSYSAYCAKGTYEYNEIQQESIMLFNIWAQAAEADEMVREAYTDAYAFIPNVVVDHSQLFIKAA